MVCFVRWGRSHCPYETEETTRTSFQEHARPAHHALRAKQGKLDVSALGPDAAQFYGYLMVPELKDLSKAGRRQSQACPRQKPPVQNTQPQRQQHQTGIDIG